MNINRKIEEMAYEYAVGWPENRLEKIKKSEDNHDRRF